MIRVVKLMETCLQKLPSTCDETFQHGFGLSSDVEDVSGSSSEERSCGHVTERPADALGRDATERLVIEETVAHVFGVEGCDLRRATRGRAKVARARQVAMYLAHVACGMSLTEVGRTFARDRTTVSHACGVIEDGRDDPTFDRVLELLENAVNAMLNARGCQWSSRGGWLLQ